MNFFYSFILLLNFIFFPVYAQKKNAVSINDSLNVESLDPLRPAKAAFYSAILPGLGQVYNKQYWKIPIVYGAIGTSVYLYLDNKKSYNIYRNEYKNRLMDYNSTDSYLHKLSDKQLINAQKIYKRNMDFSALFAMGFYILNIIDANVAASLSQFNVNEKLSLNPKLSIPEYSSETTLNFQVVYSF